MIPHKTSASLTKSGLVPIFNHTDPETALRVIKACSEAGLQVFEWTNRGSSAIGVFSKIRHLIKEELPNMLVGAGSVFDGDTAREYFSLGADFIVSPVLDPGLSETCKQLGTLYIPGAGTATEIHQAQKWGADIVKIFPGDASGGPGFVKAVLGPMPWAKLMPTGGVNPNEENLKTWFKSGVVCVGMGSKLFTKELVEDPDASALVNKIREIIMLVKKVRKKGTVNS